ncbi:hypothetical protein ACF1FE_20695 [Streptomyces griseofuscus]|uniref:hypothetical protein n=1 Tax=Streptomyces griseofuscus TaxID=146922 RepID=UPI003702E127
MSITVLTASTLLGYTIEPDPDPLTVSTAKDPVVGRLDITVGVGNQGPAYCKKVTVRIPIGTSASALTENRAPLTSTTVGASGWTARPGYAEGTWHVFDFVAERPVQVTERAVTLVISHIEVNKTAGNANIEITEETSPTNSSYTSKTTEATVTKFPAEFTFRNFRPVKVMVANGEPAILRWDGSTDAAYTMFWDRRKEQDVSNVREWTTPEPLTAPTGFMLQATVTASGDTLTHTLTTVVMVERPDLEVGHLDIAGRTKFQGPLEGLLQERVTLHESHRRYTGATDNTWVRYRTQGPGIVIMNLTTFDLPNGVAAEAIARNSDAQERPTSAYVLGPGAYGSATNLFREGQTLECRARWPDESTGGTYRGVAEWIWQPLGTQEPPVRI